ncbi:MAG: hypothetical protein RLZZ618_1418 [Pseudomonadota bacterium]
MSRWHTVAHVVFAPPPLGWRDELATRLGQRPRRLGTWAELALHGARCCLDQAGVETLPADAVLRVGSLNGARSATLACLAQCHTGSPMPFSFMQSQPSQMLAALSQHLAWQGDARFVTARDPLAWQHLVESEAQAPGLLLGWVEDGEHPRTEWWWLLPR